MLLSVAGMHVFFTAGVVFGWVSLAELLAARGEGCRGGDCSGQAAAFAFIFTLGTVGNYTSNLPFGLTLDRCGPRRCCVAASLVQLTGCLCMLMHSTGHGGGFLYVGFFLLGFGGPGIQKATFHMSNLFPAHAGSLIAASTALFDAGTAVFTGFLAARRSPLHVDLTGCWLAYSAAVLLILVSGGLLWPDTPFKPPVDKPGGSALSLSSMDEVTGAAATRPLRQQLRHPPYLYLVCFAVVHVLRLNFVVATFQEQARPRSRPAKHACPSMSPPRPEQPTAPHPALQAHSLGFDRAEVAYFVELLGRVLPLGFVGMPLIGYLLDHSSPWVTFALINVLGVLTNTLLLMPLSRHALIAAMCCVAVGRQFVYSTFFSELQRPDISSPATYGTLAGIANVWVAVSGVLLAPLGSLSTGRFASLGLYAFAPANGLMIVFSLLLCTQPLGCWKARRSEVRDGGDAAQATPAKEAHSTMERGPGASSLRVALLQQK